MNYKCLQTSAFAEMTTGKGWCFSFYTGTKSGGIFVRRGALLPDEGGNAAVAGMGQGSIDKHIWKIYKTINQSAAGVPPMKNTESLILRRGQR